jgi:hypothetical protein
MRMDLATIAARNYWPQVRALASSLAGHDPDARLHALVVDLPEGQSPETSEPNIIVHRLSELAIAPWPALAGQFSITEFCTAVKPPFLRHLFDAHCAQRVMYLDPDLMFFSSLRPTWDRFDHADILLTPHFLDPCEAESIEQEILYLQIGTFNLGFLGLADTPNVRRFLDWWQPRCWRYNCDTPGQGVFTDQQWFNLVPGMFPRVEILEDPGLNVNYYRIRHRKICIDGDGFRLDDGSPLVFFHFHKFRLSSTPEAYFRGHLDDVTARALFDRYADALRSYQPLMGSPPPSPDALAGGQLYPVPFRRAYQQMLRDDALLSVNGAVSLEDLGRALAGSRDAAPYVRAWAYHDHQRRCLGTPADLADAYRRSRWRRWWIDAWFWLFGPKALKMPPAWVDRSRLVRGARRIAGTLVRASRRLLGRGRSS